jgi:hypothetical protein
LFRHAFRETVISSNHRFLGENTTRQGIHNL